MLVAGGNAPKTSELFNGLDTIYIFDPWTETWTFQGRMRDGRWYPTTTTLPDGRVLITSGRVRDGSGNINEDVDVFTPNPDPTKRGTSRPSPGACSTCTRSSTSSATGGCW